ncbi:MAG: hypothetical protein ACXVHB_04850 [Solirubrobacteraceae bacterium]
MTAVPTAKHERADVHDTALSSSSSPPGSGVGPLDHRSPFQRAAHGTTSFPPGAYPTAMHADADRQDTSLSDAGP